MMFFLSGRNLIAHREIYFCQKLNDAAVFQGNTLAPLGTLRHKKVTDDG